MRTVRLFVLCLPGLVALVTIGCGEPLMDFASLGLLPPVIRVAQPAATIDDAAAAIVRATDSGIHAQIMTAPQYNVRRYLTEEARTEIYRLFQGMKALDARIWGTRVHPEDYLRSVLPVVWKHLRASTELGRRLARRDGMLRSTRIQFADLRGRPFRRAVGEINVRFQAATARQGSRTRLEIATPAILRPCTYVRNDSLGRLPDPPVVATPTAEISVFEALGSNWRYTSVDTIEVDCEHRLLRASESVEISHEGHNVWVEFRLIDRPRSRSYCRQAAWNATTPSSVDSALDLARKAYRNDTVELVGLHAWFRRDRGTWYHQLLTCEQLDEDYRPPVRPNGTFRGTWYVADLKAAARATKAVSSLSEAIALACTRPEAELRCEYAEVWGQGPGKPPMPYFVWATDEAQPAPAHGLPYVVYPDGRLAEPRVYHEVYAGVDRGRP